MATQCSDIGSLIQMYLDGELTDRDLHDFEHHVSSCDSCADALEEETAFHKEMRRQLAAPPASDLLKRRIEQALDDEDAAAAATARKARWNTWALPGASMIAAAAALVVFVTDAVTDPAAPEPRSEVAEVQVQKQQFAPAPAPVRRSTTVKPTPVLELPRVPESYASVDSRFIERAAREYTRIPLELPSFSNVDVTLRGFEPTELANRPAALLKYDVRTAERDYVLALYVLNARDLDLRARKSVAVGSHELAVLDHPSARAVAHRSFQNIGYVFVSNMDEDALIDVVANCGVLRK